MLASLDMSHESSRSTFISPAISKAKPRLRRITKYPATTEAIVARLIVAPTAMATRQSRADVDPPRRRSLQCACAFGRRLRVRLFERAPDGRAYRAAGEWVPNG